MKVSVIKKRAKKLGVKVRGLKKEDLIRAIQNGEGNFECFGTTKDHCDQPKCCWRKDCLKKV